MPLQDSNRLTDNSTIWSIAGEGRVPIGGLSARFHRGIGQSRKGFAGELAQDRRPLWPLNSSRRDTGMEFITKMFVKAENWRKGQTMTEYALILAAVAVVVFVTYEVMGQKITALVQAIDTDLATAS
jgi:Flp pilus assembly pilin Flp